MEQNIKIALYNAPVGTLLIKYEDDAVVFLQKTTEALQADQPTALSELVFHQLDEYFAGKRTSFDFPFRPKGTPFQMQVWEALQKIPYGEVRSYQDLAASIGRPTAWRACGSAAHANPIAIVIPCHRVIGKYGSLLGYSGGVEMKQALLKLENAQIPAYKGSV